MRKRDVPTTHEMNRKLLEDATKSPIDVSLWIDEDEGSAYINLKGASGGVFHDISNGIGLLLSMDDEKPVITGIFIEGFLHRIKKSDENEIALRKIRYNDDEKD